MFESEQLNCLKLFKNAELASASLASSHPLIHGTGIDRALGEVTGQKLALEGVDQTSRAREVAAQVIGEDRERGLIPGFVGV